MSLPLELDTVSSEIFGSGRSSANDRVVPVIGNKEQGVRTKTNKIRNAIMRVDFDEVTR
jgi:hypothetical protein